ncbi:unnamed protein product [Adineta steineri]|uniref:Uncharacterized protein n=2 Tax=Adineta steineri TaxID=433720 RepID=A0A819R011_9BILA|nr:unnamed protein product [Adineta steineri]
MKKTTSSSTMSKNQTTLGQFWSSNKSKSSSTTNIKNSSVPQHIDDDDDDDDIELLTAMEQFEKNNLPSSSSSSSSYSVPATKPPPTTTTSTSKWPITYKPEQNSKQTHHGSVSAPVNVNEHMHTYPDFDRQSGSIWIYPTNYEKRDYQYKIVSEALFQNTLVVLPTGLGKTFIAAVVMYNYCRWYPTGKIIFTAPTKPLVAQQMDACAKVMGIRKSEMCEMTGGVNPEERKRLWLEKRVFFLTPQTLNNDLVKTTCPWAKVRCLIIDEAHRALGQHAYCQVVQELSRNGEDYRILALSATPGNNVEAVQNVIQNLKISHIEMFTDDSPDIKKYSFDKIIDKIVVSSNKLMQDMRRCILSILKQPVETLAKLGVVYQKNPEHISCGSLILTMKKVTKDKPTNLNDKQYQEAKGAIFFAISFFHALDELEKHGLQSVYNFFKKKLTEDKKNGLLHATFKHNTELNEIYTQLQNLFDLSQVSTQQRRVTSVQVAHPKLAKLRECVVEHFQTFERTKTKADDQTRVIIFSEKRDSVREITELLEQDRPLVKPMLFIGQASSHGAGQGINQKLQKKVVTDFRAGGYNVLVATSIGEEGLDIGSVDLIICFDALKSPIRLVQRMGRTGRARQGRIVLLMTEGKEERTYHEGEMQQKRIFKLIIDGARMLNLYPSNLRMVPSDIQPKCQEMAVKMTDDTDTSDRQNKKKFKANDTDFNSIINKTKQQENLLKLFRKDKLLTDNEFYHWVRNYQLNDDDDDDNNEKSISTKDRLKLMMKTVIEKWSNEQREIQSQTMHSSRTKILVDFMKNYTNERIFVDIPNNTWPMDEPTPIETIIPERPKMPSPFDRSKLKEQIKTKVICSPLDLSKLPHECDQLLNLQPIVHKKDEEIDCGDLFGTGSTFDITCPKLESTNIESIYDNDDVNTGNFNITMDDLFPASQTSHLSPTLQINDVKSQQKSLFDDDDDGMDDDELLEAFNQHMESSSNQITNPSPVLVLTNRINTQHQENIQAADITLPKFDLEFSFDDTNTVNTQQQENTQKADVTLPKFDVEFSFDDISTQRQENTQKANVTLPKFDLEFTFEDTNSSSTQHQENIETTDVTLPKFDLEFSFDDINTQRQENTQTADVTLPKFDLEFSFNDLDNSDESNKKILDTSISDETTNKNNVTTNSEKFETPIRPVPSKKRVRRLSIVTPDIVERKKSKSAQELSTEQQERHFHRRLASNFLDQEASVDETLSQTVSSDEVENDHDTEHDHFIDDRQVLTQMPNIDMTSIYLKSIKSPQINIRQPPRSIPIEDIYSQLPHMTMEDDIYDEDDSFVDDTTQIIDDHHGEVDYDELANILGTQSVVHRQCKVTRRGVKFGRTSETTTPQRKLPRRVQIAQSPM